MNIPKWAIDRFFKENKEVNKEINK